MSFAIGPITIIQGGGGGLSDLDSPDSSGNFTYRMRSITEEIATTSTASIAMTASIPNNAYIIGVAAVIIEDVAGPAVIGIGLVAGDTDKWGTFNVDKTADAVVVSADGTNAGWTAAPTAGGADGGAIIDETNIGLTAFGGDFTAGLVRLTVWYWEVIETV